MKKYQYILLDWDGNLAKTLDIWLYAYKAVLEARNIHKSDQEIAGEFGLLHKTMIEWGVTDIDSALKQADTIAKQTLPNVELYPDALQVLEQLHARGYKLALITSSSHENVSHLLEKYGIRKFFDAIVAADDITEHKPHPEALEKAISLLGGDKENSVMIGDSDKDIGAANNLGIDSILFYPPEHEKFYNFEYLKSLHPTHVVSNFTDVLELV